MSLARRESVEKKDRGEGAVRMTGEVESYTMDKKRQRKGTSEEKRGQGEFVRRRHDEKDRSGYRLKGKRK